MAEHLTPVPSVGMDEAPQLHGARAAKSPTTSALINDDVARSVFGLFEGHAGLAYRLPFELLEYVELIATWNPDYSQAIDNIKTLANSGHRLHVDNGARRNTERLRGRIQEKARSIQVRHGGMDGLIDKLLRQAATFGAMCGEWVVDEDLTDVVDFADITPKSIRFFWEDDHFAPYQKVNNMQAREAAKSGQRVRGDCIKLNEMTFQYFAFNAAPGSPYGVPPFLAALPHIAIQRDMVNNMAQIVKKVGLLGIIDMTVESLAKKPNEDDAAYQARATTFLDQYASVIEEMVRSGGIVHFDDAKIETSNITGNAAGATNIFKQNEELIFSGLKSMPSVQGRSYSTTETYAGVAYDIIIRNTASYQRAVKRLVESGYWIMATMWGEGPKSISLEFNDNKTLNRLHDANSEMIEIRNALMLWAAGIIDQNTVAQRLGYDQPVVEYEAIPDSKILGTLEAQMSKEAVINLLVERLSSMDIPSTSELVSANAGEE